VIGVTGDIASGKSEVTRGLADRGSAVIDADALGHEQLEENEVRELIVDRFGAGVVDGAASSPGTALSIDRQRLAAIVFADVDSRRALEAILHPRMRARFLEAVRSAEQAAPGARARSIVLDAAILFEAGWDDLCDLTVYVEAPRPERVARAARQRGWSEASFRDREQAQWPAEAKRCRADFVVANDGDLEALGREIDRLCGVLAESPAAAATLHSPTVSRMTTLSS
jgi:dephospho-CoA kinase